MGVETSGVEFNLAPDDKILVIGAGGRMANTAYLPKFVGMGISAEHLALVDTNPERLAEVSGRYPGAQAYADTSEALTVMAENHQKVVGAYIVSNTGEHANNIRSILQAVDSGSGVIDTGMTLGIESGDLSSRTDLWSEKPVTAPEVFGEIRRMVAEQGLNISVGYILRYSETLAKLHDYIQENQLTVTGIDWHYGKDRRGDTRPTQGNLADEAVHAFSVTDLILSRAFGKIMGVDVVSALVQYRPFADEVVQGKAHADSPEIPLRPTSDVDAELHYEVTDNDGNRKIPVTVASSFLYDQQYRRVTIQVQGPDGPDALIVDFDDPRPTPENSKRKADVLQTSDGTVLYEWDGDKAHVQLSDFLGRRPEGVRGDEATNLLDHESKYQALIASIGMVAMTGYTSSVRFTRSAETNPRA